MLKSQQPACALLQGLSIFALLPQGDKGGWEHPVGGCEVGACSSEMQVEAFEAGSWGSQEPAEGVTRCLLR